MSDSIQRPAQGSLAFAAEEYANSIPKTLHRVRSALRQTNSPGLERFIRFALPKVFGRAGNLPRPALRALLQALLPIDPLGKQGDLPPIAVVIPFVEKDILALPHCVRSVLRNVRNPISTVHLVTPADRSLAAPAFQHKSSTKILETLLEDHPEVHLMFDHEVLSSEALDELRSSGAKGWDVQQLLKFGAVLMSASPATLIVDSDTVLLSRKTWFEWDGRQLLQVANEFEDRYMSLIAEYFDITKSLPLSFVTHHQLMQKDIVEEMFPRGATSLLSWWKASLENEGSYLSEYEAYGSYLFENYPKRVVLGTWSNLLSPRFSLFNSEIAQQEVLPESLIPDFCSISFHAHSQVI